MSGHDLSALPERMRGLRSRAENAVLYRRAFRPCGPFLFAEISRAIRIVLGAVGKAGFDGVIVNV